MTHSTASQLASLKRCLLYALLLGTFMTAGGCAFGRATLGDDIRPEDITTLKKGVSSRSDVVARIGAPDRILQANGREILQYYHYDLKSSSLLLLLVNFSRFNIKSDDVFVLIDREGLVEDVLVGHRTDKLTFQVWPFGN